MSLKTAVVRRALEACYRKHGVPLEKSQDRLLTFFDAAGYVARKGRCDAIDVVVHRKIIEVREYSTDQREAHVLVMTSASLGEFLKSRMRQQIERRESDLLMGSYMARLLQQANQPDSAGGRPLHQMMRNEDFDLSEQRGRDRVKAMDDYIDCSVAMRIYHLAYRL